VLTHRGLLPFLLLYVSLQSALYVETCPPLTPTWDLRSRARQIPGLKGPRGLGQSQRRKRDPTSLASRRREAEGNRTRERSSHGARDPVSIRIVASPCTVCSRPDRETIDKEVAHGVKSRRQIAFDYALSLSSLNRHVVHAVKAAGLVLRAKGETGQNGPEGRPTREGLGFANAVHSGLDRLMAGAGLAQEVAKLRSRADKLASEAEASGDGRLALLAIRELTRLLELQGRMMLEASAGRASDVASHPVWAELSGLLMHAVQPCDRCRALVTQAIRERLGDAGPS
jgi:hypothetical protein